MRTVASVLALMISLGAPPAGSTPIPRGGASGDELYRSATVVENGTLRIVTASGRIVRVGRQPTIPHDYRHVGFRAVALSDERNAVAALAVYSRSGDDPLPMALVVYANGKLRRFLGSPAFIWAWQFDTGGKRIAFQQSTLHSVTHTVYDLRDILTGRIIESATVASDERPPGWVDRLFHAPGTPPHR